MVNENVFLEIKEGMKWQEVKKILTKYNCEDINISDYFIQGEFSFPHSMHPKERKLHISNFNRYNAGCDMGGIALWGDSPMLEYIKANHRELNYEKELASIQAVNKVSKQKKIKESMNVLVVVILIWETHSYMVKTLTQEIFINRGISMNNIFEGAKFGDKFLTRDGRIAIFKSHHNTMVRISAHYVKMWIENNDCCLLWNYDGTTHDGHTHLDIVSRYQEPIDEKKLDELATKEAKKWYEPVKFESNYDFWRECFECYKAGYRKAKEE